MSRVLVVAAHPDDEVLGVGGTIARHASLGDEAFILILGEGVMSRGVKGEDGEQALAGLHRSAALAAGILGAELLDVVGLPDNRMDGVDLLDVVKHVEAAIEQVKPEIVYTHHGGDLNVDHQVTSRAVITACRPLPSSTVRRLYAYPTLSSTEWASAGMNSGFCGERYVDISGFLDAKLRALREYQGELRPFPHPRSIEAVEAQARVFGSTIGVPAAEAFKVIWDIAR
jgi:LmbE family N-acetylglucosaminyl deacetylase